VIGQIAPGRVHLPLKWRDVVAGRYLLEEPLGAGGMGAIVAATHLLLGDRVALKFVIGDASQESKATERLLREAQVTARLRSEHVVRVIDVGVARPGVLFVAMELLRGVDLRRRLAVVGRLPLELALEYALGACDALSEAHALGIVHRDVKPSNLFLARGPEGRDAKAAPRSPREVLKLLDFGVSKMATAASEERDLTGSQMIIGTPCYMAPEQLFAGGRVDGRADLWSLAAVLFECLAGSPPFRASTLREYALVLGGATRPPSLRALRGDVPKALDEALSAALAVEREERTATIDDFARALAALLPRRHPLRQRWLGPVRLREAAPVETPMVPYERAPTEMDLGATLDPSPPQVTVSVRDDAAPTPLPRARWSPRVLVLAVLLALLVALWAARHWQPPSAHAWDAEHGAPHAPQFCASTPSCASHPFERLLSQSA
jgi:serine/threonine-protein kinase